MTWTTIAIYVCSALGSVALAVLWVCLRVHWVQAVNRLPRRRAQWSNPLLADLSDIWGAPCIPGAEQPDVLPLLAQHVASLSARGHGLGVLWYFNPYYLPFARPVVLLWDPELIREVLEPRSYGRFRKGDFYRFAGPLLGAGLQSVSDGPGWTCQRHLAQQGFGPKVLDAIVPAVTGALDYLFVTWDEAATAQETLQVQGAMQALTLGIFGELAFGYNFGALEEAAGVPLCAAFHDILSCFAERGTGPPFVHMFTGRRRLGKAMAQVQKAAREVLRRRRLAGASGPTASKDLLGHLTWTEQGREGPEPVLREKLVMDNVKTFMLAGFDTTASSLTWALWLLATHANAQDRLQQEVDEFFRAVQENGEVVGCVALRKLQFLNAVVKETLRLYPTMAVARAPARQVELGQDRIGGESPYIIPRGCDLLILPYLVHRHPGYWPRADEFVPERWLADGDANGPFSRSSAYLPFGFGRRGCIGQEFALTEMRIALACIVRRYTLRPDDTKPDPPRPILRVTLAPSPVNLRLARRRAAGA